MNPNYKPKEKYIDTPEELLGYFEEYVQTIEPTKMNVIHPKLGIVELTNESPITMSGFKAWGHKVKNLTFRHYITNTDKKYDAFIPVVEHIKDFIFDRNFKGAACGKYKEQLIMRQLGMADKTETTLSVEQPLFNDQQKLLDVPENNSDQQALIP